MHKCIYWFKFQKCQFFFIMGLKDTVLIYMYPKFHACSINKSISIEFLNKLCSGVKFTFCAHMKQILLSNVLFHCCNIFECASGCDLYCNFENQAMSHSHCNTKAVSWTYKGIPLRD